MSPSTGYLFVRNWKSQDFNSPGFDAATHRISTRSALSRRLDHISYPLPEWGRPRSKNLLSLTILGFGRSSESIFHFYGSTSSLDHFLSINLSDIPRYDYHVCTAIVSQVPTNFTYRRITIQIPQSADGDQDMLNLDVGPGMTIEDLKAVVAIDTNVQPERQVFFLNGNILADGAKTLEGVGLHENDILVMQVRRVQPPTRALPQRQRLRDDAELLRLQAMGDPRVLEQLRRHKPELANAVQDSGRFREIWNRLTQEQDEVEAEKERTIARLNADPFDTEAQIKIEEMIRENAVMQNLTDTMENTPEGMLRTTAVDEHHQIRFFYSTTAETYPLHI